jgi:hypothetical protein
MSEALERLEDFLEELLDEGAERLVVRWVDETRPVPEDESGFTVKRVIRATLTARMGDEVVQRDFDDIAYKELRQTVAMYPFQTLYRSDNLTR